MYHTSRAKGTRRAALPPFGANTLLLEFGLCSPYALSGVAMIKPAHEKDMDGEQHTPSQWKLTGGSSMSS